MDPYEADQAPEAKEEIPEEQKGDTAGQPPPALTTDGLDTEASGENVSKTPNKSPNSRGMIADATRRLMRRRSSAIKMVTDPDKEKTAANVILSLQEAVSKQRLQRRDTLSQLVDIDPQATFGVMKEEVMERQKSMSRARFRLGVLRQIYKHKRLSINQVVALAKETSKAQGLKNMEELSRYPNGYMRVRNFRRMAEDDREALVFVLNKPAIQRRDDELELVKEFMTGIPVFDNAKPDVLKELCRVLSFSQLPDGEIVMKENAPSPYFCVVLEGRISVRDPEKLVRYVEAGQTLGAGCLLPKENLPRTTFAHVIAPTSVVYIERGDWEYSTKEEDDTTSMEKLDIIHKTHTLCYIDPSKLRLLVMSAFYQSFDRGEVVYKQGDEADNVYIVVSGQVRVLRVYEFEEEDSSVLGVVTRMKVPKLLEIAVIGPGEYFGERSVLNETTRQSSIVTVGQVETLVLRKVDFVYACKGATLSLIAEYAKKTYLSDKDIRANHLANNRWERFKEKQVQKAIFTPERSSQAVSERSLKKGSRGFNTSYDITHTGLLSRTHRLAAEQFDKIERSSSRTGSNSKEARKKAQKAQKTRVQYGFVK